MRYSVSLACILALMAAPLGASAQDGPELNLEEPAPAPESALEKPALQLELDDAGVQVAPTPPRTPDGYTLEEAELRVKRARIGVFTSIGVAGVGVVLVAVGVFGCGSGVSGGTSRPPSCDVAAYTGGALAAGGAISAIATLAVLGRRAHDRDSLREAHHGTSRRVRWDLTQSRLVF